MPLPPSAYPALGVRYLVTNKRAHNKVVKFVAATGGAYAVITGVLLSSTFSWHKALLGHLLPIDMLSTVLAPLVIAVEAAVPVYLGAGHWLRVLQGALFDEVLCERGVQVARLPAEDLQWVADRVQQQRRQQAAQPLAARITRRAASTLLSYAPLSALPPFGPAVALALGSYSVGEHYHRHYLSLKGLHSGEARQLVAGQHAWAYRQFGLAAAVLDCVPLANWATVFSNTVAAALWAADLERSGHVLVRRPGTDEPAAGR